MKRVGLVCVVLVCALPASAARLPIVASHDWWPVYSPDAQWVAFTRVSGQGRRFALEVVPAGGGGRPVRLAQSSYQVLPSWSPDSTHLAYQAGGHVYSVARDGSDRRIVADGGVPDWSPVASSIAYVRDGALRVASSVLATGLIGKPDWSPDGTQIAFARSDGVYAVTLGGGERMVAATTGEPSAPAWSYDGRRLVFTAAAEVYVVAADGATAAAAVAGPFATLSPPSWVPLGDALAYTADGHLTVTSLGRPPRTVVGGRAEVGAAYHPGSLNGYVLVYSGVLAACPGHSAIQVGGGPVLSGTCAIAGTAGADVIEGTPREGDVILAGAGDDRVYANDGHTDRVDCGPGRDIVWADRTDRLKGCEIVHR